MSPADCHAFASHLGAFVDGELTGTERRQVALHMAGCARCATEASEIRSIGEGIRLAASGATQLAHEDLAGLADGVIERVEAEREQSWRGLLTRAQDEWRWMALVGGGALVGSLGTAVIALNLMLLVPTGASLAGLINNLGSSAGTLMVLAAPEGDSKATAMLMQVEGVGSVNEPFDASQTVMPSTIDLADENEMARDLAETVTHDGHLIEFGAMTEQKRRYTESLLENMHRLRPLDPARAAGGPVTVYRMFLFTNTSVSAKAL
jgi:hypothetical protein